MKDLTNSEAAHQAWVRTCRITVLALGILLSCALIYLQTTHYRIDHHTLLQGKKQKIVTNLSDLFLSVDISATVAIVAYTYLQSKTRLNQKELIETGKSNRQNPVYEGL